MQPLPHPLNQVYAAYMRNHPYGTAVYCPIPFRDFHPGSVGYFDANGEWNIITDLSNATTLQSSNFSPVPEPLQRAPTDSHIEWGPKASRNINSRKAEFSAGVSPALATVLPANASAHLTFYNSTAGGSLLLTTPPITHERFYHETPFKRWVHNNAVELVRQRKELLEYGLWIVLSTHTTSDCAIHVWDEAQKTVDVGFDVSVDAVGELGPAGGWTIGRGDGGWERYTSTGDEQGRVVFFGGLYFRPRRVPIGEYLKPRTLTYSSQPRLASASAPAPKMVSETVSETVPEPVPETVADVFLPDRDIAVSIEYYPFLEDTS